MIIIETVYYYGQDGEIVSDEIKRIFKLGTQEMEYSDNLRKDVFNVVGFVFQKEKILVIFPKHFMEYSEIVHLNESHLESKTETRLLYEVIKKYSESENTTATARKYIGAIGEAKYESDYPFAPFFEVYEYYQKYGLYREKDIQIKNKGTGKVAWKQTIQKSQKIISGGNLLFSPLYVYKKNFRHVFVTECMEFVIGYTLDFFHDFLNLQNPNFGKPQFDYFSNIDYVIAQLNKAKGEVFKDVQKKLIQSLIDFFVQYKTTSYGGKTHVKIRHFNMVWQKMVGAYLNRHFIGMDESRTLAKFDASITESSVRFEDMTFNDIDDSHHNFSIDIDHAAFEDDELYIFDSKYYSNANDLNYKQFAYNEILRYVHEGLRAINNVLLLPGRMDSGLHFSLSDKYIGESRKDVGCKIIEQYLNPIDIMKDYVEG